MTPDELNGFYCALGQAIWNMQYLEEGLGYLYVYKVVSPEQNSLTEEQVGELLLSVQKKTLGALINGLVKSSSLSEELKLDLEHFNKERRWLVHKCVIENGDDLYNSIGRERTFARVSIFTEEAIRLQKAIAAECKNHLRSLGADVEKFEGRAERELKKLKGLA